MESLSLVLSSSLPLQNHSKTPKSSFSKPISLQLLGKSNNLVQTFTKTHLSFTIIDLFTSLPCIASETTIIPSVEPVSNKIDLEKIIVSVDDFITRYPFFVPACTFIWLVVIPIVEYNLNKCKFIYANDAFEKLRDDPTAQLLDIRNAKTLVSVGSPNLSSVNKSVVQLEFNEEDEDGFLKNVLDKFADPANTVVCILDNFDGNSMQAAQLLFKNGFKEAYAIKDGVRGRKGWLARQEKRLPPSVHILPKKKKKKVKTSKRLEINGVNQQTGDKNEVSSSGSVPAEQSQIKDPVCINDTKNVNVASRSSSPYPNYPDMKPPSSPTPSKP